MEVGRMGAVVVADEEVGLVVGRVVVVVVEMLGLEVGATLVTEGVGRADVVSVVVKVWEVVVLKLGGAMLLAGGW